MTILRKSLFAAILAATLFPFASASADAIRLVSPQEGATVPLLSDGQKAWLDRTRAERRVSFADKKQREEMRALGYVPLKVRLEWEWTPPADCKLAASARPLFTVEVRRLPDGVPVFRADCPEPRAEVGNLEIAREYEWTVWASVLGRVGPAVTGRFRTEDHAPRLIALGAVPNVRDLGGRIGLDGRRVRQGLVFRSAGLNDNASDVFSTREEVLAEAADPDALLAKEKAFKDEADVFRAFRANPGSLRLMDCTLSPSWTVFRTTVPNDDFIAKGLPAVLELADVPEEFLGGKAETATLDDSGRFAFPDDVHKAAKGPAVFVQVADFPEDGWISLGCGADWWWTLAVNGEIVFDRSFNKGNEINPVSAANHVFAVPVKKGRNVFAAAVACGAAGWVFCCKGAPAEPVATVIGNTLNNIKARAEALFKVKKGRKPGNTRINDENRPVALRALGIRSDIDLRSDGECYGMEGSPLGPTVTWWHYSSACYSAMKDDWGREAFANVFRVFLNPANYPIDFHCIAGQDRTGAVAFIINGLLGVDEEDLYRDWETTGFWNPNPSFCHARLFDHLVKVFDKYPGDTINKRIEAYVLSLGFTENDIATLRDIMLE